MILSFLFALLEHHAPTKLLFNNTYVMLYLKMIYFCCVQRMKFGCLEFQSVCVNEPLVDAL